MNEGYKARFKELTRQALLAGLVYSVFEGVYLCVAFPVTNLSWLMESVLTNLILFLIVEMLAFTTLSALRRFSAGYISDVTPAVLSALIFFPVYFFLFYLLEGTNFIYRFFREPKTIVFSIAILVMIPFFIVSRLLRGDRHGRFGGLIMSIFFFITLGQYNVDWRALVRGERAGYLGLLAVAASSVVLYFLSSAVARTIFRRGLLPIQGRRARSLLASAMGLAIVASVWLAFRDWGPITPSGPSTKPNILLIVLDTARADRFSCYGHERETTPFLEKFAETATLYKNTVSAAPWTLPSHASIFTGLYPSAHGATWKTKQLGDQYLTLAEFLSTNGYETVGFCNNPAVNEMDGLAQGFDQFIEVWQDNIMNPTLSLRIDWFLKRFRGEDDGGAMRTNRWIMEWLEKHGERDRPFFLFVNLMECHLWYDAPESYHEMFVTGDLSETVRNLFPDDLYPILTGDRTLSDWEWKEYGEVYDGDLRYLDRKLEELFGLLDEKGFLDNTIAIITSDHGEHLGEHGMMGHMMSLYQPLLRVPMMIRLPEGMPKLPEVEGPVQTLDIFPTLVELLGGQDSLQCVPMQGVSLLDTERKSARMIVAEHEPPKERISAFLEKNPNATSILRFERVLRSIMVDSLKLIWSSKGESELYDLQQDPLETRNLAAERQGDVRRLEARLQEWLASFKHADVDEGAKELDEETHRRLRALGYVN